MKSFFLKLGILTGMLIGLPLSGVFLIGLPVSRYLEFPPETRYVQHAPFSWLAFAGCGVFILAVAFPLSLRAIRSISRFKVRRSSRFRFPWWGWVGMATGTLAWILAWTRFSWFERFQPHTFTPLWFSLILFINAMVYRRDGHCMMVGRPGVFLLLFPASAAFWWFFEYLNRFVQNWYYTGVLFSSWEYFWYATLCYSTVLPAVLGMRELILGFSWFEKGFGNFFPIEFPRPIGLAWVVLVASGVGLVFIGVWPDYLFPLVWVSPVLIIVSLQTLMGEHHVLQDITRGDWRMAVSSALAALFCGFFWEMWNYYSLSKWGYAIPFVERYKIFEMPILGYAGYLPFGLECAVIGRMLASGGSDS